MIILDEQLLGRNLDEEIARWYRGSVRYITDLRPNTVIKDDAIPALLRKQRQPTFVTINEKDFWTKVKIDESFCVVCFAWPDSKTSLIPSSLRELFKLNQFNTKRVRMGKVVRVTATGISYYTHERTVILEVGA